MVTARGDQVDDYHGELVADPYRWLEDTDSPETRAWIQAQNDRTAAFLAAVPARPALRARLSELWDYPRYEVPFRAGSAWFQRRNSGLQDQSVLYVMTSPDDGGRVLLDPNLLSRDGTVAVTTVAVSDDGSLLAYATSTAGSDWSTWHVREVASGADRADVVEWSRYGTAAWRDVSGFYYSATDRPQPGAELTGQVGLVRIFFHALGAPQAEDSLIFEAPEEPEWLPHATVTEDGRFLVISISRGTNPESQVLVLDHARPELGPAALGGRLVLQGARGGNIGPTFFVVTDDQAERQRLVAIDLDHPDRRRVDRGRPRAAGRARRGEESAAAGWYVTTSRTPARACRSSSSTAPTSGTCPCPRSFLCARARTISGIEGRADSPLAAFRPVLVYRLRVAVVA